MGKSIYIDATHYETLEPTGVERYVDALLPLLSKELISQRAKVSWIGHDRPTHLPKGVHWVESAYQTFWSQRRLPKLLASAKPNLYFTPSGILPVTSQIPGAMTIHDLSFYEYPGAYSAGDLFRLKMISPMAARKAVALCAPTQFVKDDVVRHWNVPAERVTITPLAYTPLSGSEKPVEAVTESLQYVLYVGRIEEKKNLLPVIHAVAASQGLTLVLAGKPGHGGDKILAAIREFPDSVQKRIIRLGYVTDSEQQWLYRHAAAVVVPGLAEGFGLPVLEGFYYKVPVVASASGSLPEVAGDAAVLIDGRSSTAWQETLEEIIREPMLRTSLLKRGAERLNDFSWQHCAELTAQSLLEHLE